MSDGHRPSGYPIPFNLLLIAIVPIGFLAAMLSLMISLPIGELVYRIAAASLIAIIPPLLALRASAALRRRNVRGLLRAPVAIAMILMGYAAIIGGLYQWRGLRPPHLVKAADHLHRVYLLGEQPPPLEVIEPRPPLNEIYDHILKNPPQAELAILQKEGAGAGMDAIEIWSSEGDFRARFLGVAARAERMIFFDAHRLLAVRATGGALILDAEKLEVLHTLDLPEPLSDLVVETSSGAAIIAGTTPSGELAIHRFSLERGALQGTLRSKDFVAFGVTSDLRRALIVKRGKKNVLTLVAHHLPSGDLEANIPQAILTDVKKRKLTSVTGVVPMGEGERAVIFDGTSALLWDVMKKKASPFPLAKTKIYPYAIAAGGHAYFHRRTDAGDPNPTGIYRLPGGEKLIELPTRGQPPRAFFIPDGRSIAIGPAIFSTIDGRILAGTMPESFTLEREHFWIPARDGSALVEPGGDEQLRVRSANLADLGTLPVRSEHPGAISAGGKLYAVRVRYPFDKWMAVLKDLDEWKPKAPAG